MKKIYIFFRSYLKNHGKIAFMLSHGLIHMILVVFLIIVCVYLYTIIQSMNTPFFKQLSIQVAEHTGNSRVEALRIALNLKGNPSNFMRNGSYAKIWARLSEPDGEQKVEWPEDDSIKDSCNCHGSIFMRALTGDLGTTLAFSEGKPFYGMTEHGKDTFAVAITKRLDDWLGQEWFFSEKLPEYKAVHKGVDRFMWVDYTGSSLFKDKEDVSPYYNFWISIVCDLVENPADMNKVHPDSAIMIEYADRDSTGLIYNPIAVDKIIPEPSILKPNQLIYVGNEKIQEVLDNHGIYFMGVDLTEKNKAEKKIFLYTILIGTLLAFILDILVELVVKWKRLAQKRNSHFKSRISAG